MEEVLPIRIRNGAFINYTYLVNDHKGNGVLIDPGAEFDRIVSVIRDAGVTLHGVLLTHHHSDHCGLAAAFARLFGTPVYMGREEIDFYRFECPNLAALEPDAVLIAGGMEIFSLHTPGHTAGGRCYRIGRQLFTGDTLFAEGCGMCFGRGSDPAELYASLRKIRSYVDDETKIYPGHSYGAEPGLPFGRVRKENIYFHLGLQDFIRFRMRNNQKKLFNFK